MADSDAPSSVHGSQESQDDMSTVPTMPDLPGGVRSVLELTIDDIRDPATAGTLPLPSLIPDAALATLTRTLDELAALFATFHQPANEAASRTSVSSRLAQVSSTG